jgi:hypothetical protein
MGEMLSAEGMNSTATNAEIAKEIQLHCVFLGDLGGSNC